MGPPIRGRLRVAVPVELTRLSPRSGHGRMWANILSGLRAHVELLVHEGGEGPARRVPWRRRSRPEVWLISGHADPPAAAVRSGAPIVAQVHEASWEDPELAGFLDPRMRAVMRDQTAAAVAAAAQLITPSVSSRRQVLDLYGLPEHTVHAVPHGVDAVVFRPGLAGGGALVAATLPRRQPRPYVLFVGVVHPRKNLGALREAMRALAGEGYEHALAIVGGRAADRDDPDDLIAAAGAELTGAPGRIAFIPDASDDDLAALMAGADAFCLPSYGEGFGIPALEAMACGAPVVVSDRGALPEVVGEAGLVVTPTAAAVHDALVTLLADRGRARALALAGRDRALTFSWERAVDGWLSVLRNAASSR
jgi:glycosyltransferase involved in cell wall biosynthesis